MTTDATETKPPAKRRLMPLLLGVGLAVAGGAGGYLAASSGLIGGVTADAAPTPSSAAANLVFVPIEPMVLSLGPASRNTHLRFRAQLEVDKTVESEVTKLMPRVVDVLSGYLRAVELHDIEDPSALVRLRAQMLRRIQIVMGPGKVRDLLVMEFVLS